MRLRRLTLVTFVLTLAASGAQLAVPSPAAGTGMRSRRVRPHRRRGTSKASVVAVVIVAAAASLALPRTALAATNTFNNNPGNDWNTAANWSQNEVPDGTDDVVIPAGESAFIAEPDGVANSLTLGGTLFLNGSTLTIGAGSSSITNTLTVRDGATLDLGASTTLNAPATTNALQVENGSTVTTGANVTWSSGRIAFISGGNRINIGSGEVVNITGTVNTLGGDTTDLWRNEGTLNRTTSTAGVSIAHQFENDGAVNVLTGTLTVGGDGPGESAGDYTVAADATLTFQAPTGADPNDIVGAGAGVAGGGKVFQTRGTTRIGDGASFAVGTLDFATGGTLDLDSNGNVDDLAVTGTGIRSGDGTLTVNETTTLAPGFLNLELVGPGTTTLNGTAVFGTTGGLFLKDGHTLNLPATTTWSSGAIFLGGGTINVGSGDVLNLTGNVGTANTSGAGANLIRNEGTINRTTSAGPATINHPSTSSGNINVDSGTLSFNAGVTQTGGVTDVDGGATLGGSVTLQGGTLEGAGSVSGAVTNIGGTVKPGASPGTLTLADNYTQGSGGVLEIEVAGTTPGAEHDRLVVGQNAVLDGTLAVVNDPGFTPSTTDTFDVLTAGGTVTGTFSALTGTNTPVGTTYRDKYTVGEPGSVTLFFACASPTIPGATDGADTITGTPGNDVIDGKGGIDTIDGKGGNDILCGGGENDVLKGGPGKDTLFGDGGDDQLFGGGGNDVLEGDAGGDTLKGGKGRDRLDGGTESDVCKGGPGKDRAANCP